MDAITVIEVAGGVALAATLTPLYLLYLDRIRDAMVKNNSPSKE